MKLVGCLLAVGAAGCLRIESSNPADAAVGSDAQATPDAPQPPVASKQTLIMRAAWKRTALVSTPAYDWYANGVITTDLLSSMLPCEADNRFVFKLDRSFLTDEGLTKCDARDSQQSWESWVFAEDETVLVFDSVDRYTLLELTETTLKFESTFIENGVTYTHVETYSH